MKFYEIDENKLKHYIQSDMQVDNLYAEDEEIEELMNEFTLIRIEKNAKIEIDTEQIKNRIVEIMKNDHDGEIERVVEKFTGGIGFFDPEIIENALVYNFFEFIENAIKDGSDGKTPK